MGNDRAATSCGADADRDRGRADRALSIRTLRHYDEVGLVPPSARSGGGFRLSTVEDVERLITIRRMKPLGFTLEEMRQVLDALAVLRDDGSPIPARDTAMAVIADFGERVEQSCRSLRTQLAYAEELTSLLDALGAGAT